jgi:adenylosuccinate synthase
LRGWEQARPIYEELPGWREPLGGVRAMADLPATARRYVDRLSALVAAPVVLLSIGAQRDQTVRLGNVF